jgi:hypothetical protein
MPEYHATDRMPVDEIVIDARVFVPEWKSGSVIGWTHGTVIKVQAWKPADGVAAGDNDTSYIVRLDNGDERLYYGWSIGNPHLFAVDDVIVTVPLHQVPTASSYGCGATCQACYPVIYRCEHGVDYPLPRINNSAARQALLDDECDHDPVED